MFVAQAVIDAERPGFKFEKTRWVMATRDERPWRQRHEDDDRRRVRREGGPTVSLIVAPCAILAATKRCNDAAEKFLIFPRRMRPAVAIILPRWRGHFGLARAPAAARERLVLARRRALFWSISHPRKRSTIRSGHSARSWRRAATLFYRSRARVAFAVAARKFR